MKIVTQITKFNCYYDFASNLLNNVMFACHVMQNDVSAQKLSEQRDPPHTAGGMRTLPGPMANSVAMCLEWKEQHWRTIVLCKRL